jgi:2-dehydro-3-deoxygluconokinase
MTADVVLCVGEPLIVLSPPKGESLESSARLCVSIGGAEANVAVHLARLGVATRFAGRVGADPFGRKLRDVLAGEGVDVAALEVDGARPTGIYVKEPTASGTIAHYYRRGSAASAMESIAPGTLDGVALVHVTGILAALGRGCARVVAGLLDDAVPVSFDVNHRPALWENGDAGAALLDLARRADVVFVGLDEAAQLWGCADAAAVREVLPGVELVVKDAGRTAVAFRGGKRIEVAALPVPVIEPVGAGDAFAAGYLAARRGTVEDGDLARALRTGHAVAASALSTGGDQGERVDPALLRAATTGASWPECP